MGGPGSPAGMYLVIQTHVQVCHDAMQLWHVKYRICTTPVGQNRVAAAENSTTGYSQERTWVVQEAVPGHPNTCCTGVP